MKSSTNVRAGAAGEAFTAWNPQDLLDDLPAPRKRPQAEQLMAILGGQETGPGSRAGAAQQSTGDISSDQSGARRWLPADIGNTSEQAHQKDWVFVDLGDNMAARFSLGVRSVDFSAQGRNSRGLPQARAEAERIVAEAHAAAEELMLRAQQEIETQKKDGYEQGRTEAQQDLRQALDAVHAMQSEVGQWQQTLTAQGESILTEMVKDIARTMFGEGVSLDPHALQMNLNRVMENAQALGDLTIFLNPQDATQLDPSWSEYQRVISGNKLRILPSATIRRGGCIVKGHTGIIDATVQTQLDAVLHAVEEASPVGR